MSQNDLSNSSAEAYKVSIVSITVNILLSLLKLIVGIVGRSSALVSDAVHSASDVFSTIVVIIGINISNKASDEGHPYGHERLESVAAFILATVLAVTGVGIGVLGVEKIVKNSYSGISAPSLAALITAAVSIAVKEWMYWYTRACAKKINSDALMADAWHHRSDALSSVGSLIGIGGAILGLPILDPIASIVICIFILKAAFDIFKDALNKLVDKACDRETIAAMENVILSDDKIIRIDMIKTRLFGAKVYVDVEIGVEGALPLIEAHAIAERAHDRIENSFENVKHCMVHVNPVSQKHEEV